VLNSRLNDDAIEKYAWLRVNAERVTHPVGSLDPTPAGFYDLIGNVWEWTENPIYYDSGLEPFEGAPHLCFGGSWRDEAPDMDNLITNYPLDFRHEHLGFRLAREIGNPEEDL
jgi:formylglycine-generating enzyme required for sulfatase activity